MQINVAYSHRDSLYDIGKVQLVKTYIQHARVVLNSW